MEIGDKCPNCQIGTMEDLAGICCNVCYWQEGMDILSQAKLEREIGRRYLRKARQKALANKPKDDEGGGK